MQQLQIEKCAFCGEFKPKGRSDREYCSSACKQRAYRWRKRLERYHYDAVQALGNIASYGRYPEMQRHCAEVLKDVEKQLFSARLAAGVKKVVLNG